MQFSSKATILSILISSLIVGGCSKKVEVAESKTPKDEIEESFNAFEERITSFDLANYPDISKPNPIKENISSKCVNGFGGESSPIHSGMFSENLFSLDAESGLTDTGKIAYVPYVKSFALVGDILFEKHIDGFDRSIVTMPQLTRGFSDLQIFENGKSIQNKFSRMESQFGFPVNYIKQQAGNIVTFADFNNNCEKNVRVIDREYKKVHLRGLPIADILTADYTNTSHHGLNGIYSVTHISYHYIPENIVKWLQSNQNFYKVLSGNTWRFPEGAYMYVPKSAKALTETVRVDISEANKLNASVEEYQKELSSMLTQSEGSVVFVEEKIGDYIILKPHLSPSGEPLHEHGAIVIKGNEAFLAEWTKKGNVNFTKHDVGASASTMFNDKAITYLVGAIKKNYQGKKLDSGQPWEDMNKKLALSQFDDPDQFNPTELPLETLDEEEIRMKLQSKE